MNRRPMVAGNWKLHKGPKAATALALGILDQLLDVEDVDLAVFPTALSVSSAQAVLNASRIDVGIQMVHADDHGAHTGQNSATMAREVGCTWALIGHSEVRSELHQSDSDLAGSLAAVLRAGLLPMLCIGETLEERQSDQLESVLTRQLASALEGLEEDQLMAIVIAYEPVWAIGTGVTATPSQAQDAHAWVRQWLRDHCSARVADSIRLLYGGSIKPHNAAELFAQPDIDGGLVGGASLTAESFAAIARAAGSR